VLIGRGSAGAGRDTENALGGLRIERGNFIMATIGTFTKKNGAYLGDIKTAALMLTVKIVPAEKGANPKGPDFRVRFVDDEEVELGAGWLARSKKGNAYISLKLDCPSFASPMHCNLVQSQRGYALRWDRKKAGESEHTSTAHAGF